VSSIDDNMKFNVIVLNTGPRPITDRYKIPNGVAAAKTDNDVGVILKSINEQICS